MVNWSSYNQSLVRRGEVMLDFDVIDSWHSELKRMNDGKKGAQYDYPNSFVQLLGYMRVYFHLPYRQTEGVIRAHAGKRLPAIPDYSTISRRLNKLNIKIKEKVGNDIVITLDSTGIKVANRGDWLCRKWNVGRKGYLKIHVAVDIKKKKIISLEVTSEEVHDNKMLKKIVDNASKNNDVKRVLADGTYDSKKNFQYLYDNNIEAAIKVRKNSTGRSMGCYPRKIAVLQQLKDFNKWKASVSYGYRWIAETVVFSSFKRMFGEYVSARRFPNMANELILKASLYNMFTAIKA
jgi:hypothetical protein